MWPLYILDDFDDAVAQVQKSTSPQVRKANFMKKSTHGHSLEHVLPEVKKATLFNV